MQIIDDLKAIRKLIDNPLKWTRHKLHKERKFGPFKIQSHCIIGAFEEHASTWNTSRKETDDRRSDLFNALHYGVFKVDGYHHSIPGFNDQATHREVMRVFDIAILATEEKAKYL